MKRVFLVFTPLERKLRFRAVRNKFLNRTSFLTGFIPAVFLLIVTPCFASSQKLPIIDGKEIVAMVNDEPITLEELNNAIASIHTEMTEEKKTGSIDYSAILNRLINIKLILQEARNVGIDELPQIKDIVDKYSRETLTGLFRRQYVKEVKVDEEEVDKFYKEAVKEWKIKSVLFEKEDEAKKIEEEIKASKNFDDIAKKLVAEETAKEDQEGEYLRDKDFLPDISAALAKMEIGSVSPVIKVGESFVILKLEDVRFTENPEVREQVKQELLNRKRGEALQEYGESLIKEYVEIDKELLDSLDYDSAIEEFQKLLKDSRVVARIKGEKPVTVGELTEAVKKEYFHGVEGAIRDKKLNDKKKEIVENILLRVVFVKEALKQGIDKTGAYKDMVKEYENSVVFETFINKVITPDIKVSNDELKEYYNKNIDEYSYPEMMKINSLVFKETNAAKDAIDKLRKGTDFKWLSANAGGQVDKNTKGLLRFEGNVLIIKKLPEEIQKILSGVNPGDFRLYESPEGYSYVLYIQDVLPPRAQPFENIKEIIMKRAYNDKLKKTIEEWIDKLREFYEIEIYATDLK